MELVLVQIGGEVGRVFLVRRLACVLMPQLRERSLDPLALGRQQCAGPLWIHQSHVTPRTTSR